MLIAEILAAEILADLGPVDHRFFTREGGVSEGAYASLNCGLGSGDDPDRVRTNRARAMAALDLAPSNLATGRQVHSSRVAVVERPWPDGARPELDGLVTRTPGVALGILTADCAPVLFADPDSGVIGAAHAGWRGAKAGVLEATIGAMVQEGARTRAIRAAVGPCIGQDSYQVAADFHQAFVTDERLSARFFRAEDGTGRFRFDLPGYVADRLEGLGLAVVAVLPFDTCGDPDRFFSYRRNTLDGTADYGRQLSAIALRA
jgi:hypothetical protein